jgi:hypothetical protein
VEEKPAANGPTGMGQLLDDTVDMENKAESRLKALEALRAEHTALQQEHDLLKAAVSLHGGFSAVRELMAVCPAIRDSLTRFTVVPDLPATTVHARHPRK